ncbi:MAG: hypothetical protein MJZ71_01495 [Bacteroidales bacterium]|nr:hypothetical protein [Bacteroidales bacterium]
MNLKVLTIITASIMLLSANVLNAQNKTDDKGRKQGHWVKTAKNGKKISEGNFKDDYPVDTFYYYDSKGKVAYKNFFTNQGKDSHTILLHTNGVVKAEGDYINKQKQGLWKYYNEKGKRVTEVIFLNNEKSGEEKVWDDDGKNVIQVTTYRKGKKEGAFFKSLYSDGYYTCTYMNDKLNGEYKEYFPSKQLRVKGLYKEGMKQGDWFVYKSSNEVIQKLLYKNDLLIQDIIVLHTMDGVKDIPQSDIALIRPAGKQTQLIRLNGEKMNCVDDFETLLNHINAEKFYRMDEKGKIYVNIDVLRGLNADGSVQTSVDFGFKIIPDSDGKQMIYTLFRQD